MSDRAELLARHVSPDGELVWRVERELDADGRAVISFGFEGLAWHLHPDQIDADGSDLDIAVAVADDLINDRLVVIRADWPGGYRYCLLGDLALEIDLKSGTESLSFRLWSGRPLSVEELIDGVVGDRPLRLKGI